MNSSLSGDGYSLKVGSFSFGSPVGPSDVSKPIFEINVTEYNTKVSTPMLSVSGKNIYVIFHIFYHIIFSCLDLRLRGNITSHSPLTCSVFILDNVSNSLPPFDDPNLKTPDPLVME